MSKLKYLICTAILFLNVGLITPSASFPFEGPCPYICGEEYDPQCATLFDGSKRQFSNKCWLSVESCRWFIGVRYYTPGPCHEPWGDFSAFSDI